ncbi:MAG: carbonic anhydrase [Planctomycetota bacterium]
MLWTITAALISFAPDTVIRADDALDLLITGNSRWVAGCSTAHEISPAELARAASEPTAPFATIVTSSDSRLPVEMIFDRPVGDLFVVRVSGPTAEMDRVGSVEYGALALGTPLLVVMAHAELAPQRVPNDPMQLPGIRLAERNEIDRVRAEVYASIASLLRESRELSASVQRGDLTVFGAGYDMASGQVHFFGQHPEQQLVIAPQ